MADEIDAAEREVADEVEDLVPGRCVGMAELVFDEAVRAEDEQVFGREVPADADGAEREGFALEDERPAVGDFAGERLRETFMVWDWRGMSESAP